MINYDQTTIQQIIKKRSPKNIELYAKGVGHLNQKLCQIYQKTMPTLVTEKIMTIIKNHVSLNGKTIETNCKDKLFMKVSQVVCANGKGITQASKIIHPQVNEQSMQKLYS